MSHFTGRSYKLAESGFVAAIMARNSVNTHIEFGDSNLWDGSPYLNAGHWSMMRPAGGLVGWGRTGQIGGGIAPIEPSWDGATNNPCRAILPGTAPTTPPLAASPQYSVLAPYRPGRFVNFRVVQASWRESKKLLTVSGIGTDTAAGSTVVIEGGTGATPGSYIVGAVPAASSFTGATYVHATKTLTKVGAFVNCGKGTSITVTAIDGNGTTGLKTIATVVSDDAVTFATSLGSTVTTVSATVLGTSSVILITSIGAGADGQTNIAGTVSPYTDYYGVTGGTTRGLALAEAQMLTWVANGAADANIFRFSFLQEVSGFVERLGRCRSPGFLFGTLKMRLWGHVQTGLEPTLKFGYRRNVSSAPQYGATTVTDRALSYGKVRTWESTIPSLDTNFWAYDADPRGSPVMFVRDDGGSNAGKSLLVSGVMFEASGATKGLKHFSIGNPEWRVFDMLDYIAWPDATIQATLANIGTPTCFTLRFGANLTKYADWDVLGSTTANYDGPTRKITVSGADAGLFQRSFPGQYITPGAGGAAGTDNEVIFGQRTIVQVIDSSNVIVDAAINTDGSSISDNSVEFDLTMDERTRLESGDTSQTVGAFKAAIARVRSLYGNIPCRLAGTWAFRQQSGSVASEALAKASADTLYLNYVDALKQVCDEVPGVCMTNGYAWGPDYLTMNTSTHQVCVDPANGNYHPSAQGANWFIGNEWDEIIAADEAAGGGAGYGRVDRDRRW